jgi:hypothetical protein
MREEFDQCNKQLPYWRRREEPEEEDGENWAKCDLMFKIDL